VKLLIVDDEVELVETLVTRLRRRDISAVGVSSGREALKSMSTQSFDVILVDVKMPGMSGIELLEEIKERTPNQLVVMLTGHGSPVHSEEGERLGAFAYLMKPIKLPKLIEILTDANNHEKETA